MSIDTKDVLIVGALGAFAYAAYRWYEQQLAAQTIIPTDTTPTDYTSASTPDFTPSITDPVNVADIQQPSTVPTTVGSGVSNYSSQLVAFVMSWEGFKANFYGDVGGQAIGYGHLVKPGESITAPITPDQATALLYNDLDESASYVMQLVHAPLNQNQFDALTSFMYVFGPTKFNGSTMQADLNAGNYTGAAMEFPRWIYVSGVVSAGEVARRQAEQAMFTSGVYQLNS